MLGSATAARYVPVGTLGTLTGTRADDAGAWQLPTVGFEVNDVVVDIAHPVRRY